MIDIDVYYDRVTRLAREIEPLSETTFEILGSRHRAGERTVVDCVDFRRAMLSDVDRRKLNFWLEFGFFRDRLPTDVRLAGYAFASEVAEEVQRLRMRTLCAPYRRSDPLFAGAPPLWNSLRDGELIDFTALRQQHGSEVVAVPGGYGKIPGELDPHLVAWLSRVHPELPFFVRLAPDRFFPTRPPMLLTEAVIAPGRFDALMSFDMYRGQTEYGEYVLQDEPFVPGAERRHLDYHVEKIRRLEIRAERRKHMLTMMIEEVPAPDHASGLMVGRCIHLDADMSEGGSVHDASLSHLDLALNVYEGAARADRYDCRLREGKVTNASFRTHLMRIEGIPLMTLLPICADFLKSETLLREWAGDLQVPVRPASVRSGTA
jgi:hypothetical protein